MPEICNGAARATGRWFAMAAAAVVLTACGGGGGSSPLTDPAASTVENPVTPPVPPQAPAGSGTLVVLAGIPGGAGMLDGKGRAARFNLNQANQRSGAAVDAAGNLFVTDTGNDRIRRIAPNGEVTTWAIGVPGPTGLAIDGQGNLFAAAPARNQIFRISVAGAVTVYAGSGSEGSADGPAATAQFISPTGLAVGSDGTLYVGDLGNRTIRKISPEGMVSTFAGQTGVSGYADGPASQARFADLSGLAIDEAGTLWVSERFNQAVRTVDPAGNVTTAVRFSGLDRPGGIAVHNSVAYVQTLGIGTIQKIVSGTLVTVAGSGIPGYADGAAADARFSGVGGMAFDAAGNLFVIDALSSTVRKLDLQGLVSTLAGAPALTGSADGPAAFATFNFPDSIAQDAERDLYVSDSRNNAVRNIANGAVTTLAGGPVVPTVLAIPRPAGLVSDDQGNLDVVQGTDLSLRHIASTGALGPSTSSGGERICFGFCLNGGRGSLTRDGSGGFYLSDPGWQVIRRIDAQGRASVFAGTPAGDLSRYGPNGPNTFAPGTYSADGTGPAAVFDQPNGLATDAAGNLYVADTGNNTIRKVTAGGVVSTFAGVAGPGGDADGPAATARFNAPIGLAFDGAGYLYVTDRDNSLVRRISPAGVVTTVAGQRGKRGVAAGALPSTLNAPFGIAVGRDRELYVTDVAENVVLRIDINR